MLQVIALVDKSPDLVEYREKALSELVPFRCRSRHFIKTSRETVAFRRWRDSDSIGERRLARLEPVEICCRKVDTASCRDCIYLYEEGDTDTA